VSQYDKQAIAQARFITGESIQAIADSLQVSRRSVERWAEKGNWRNLREVNGSTPPVVGVIQNSKFKIQDAPSEVVDFEIEEPENPLAIANSVISTLQQELARPMHGKDRATIANSLRSWVELRRKLSPPTVGELADLVIELNVSIPEFVTELKARYGMAGDRG
jgi:hypothetical protein